MLSKLMIWLCEPFFFASKKVYGIFAEIEHSATEINTETEPDDGL